MNRIGKILTTTFIAGVVSCNAFAKDFSDLPQNHWAKNEIQKLAADNVVVGYPDNTFRPDEPATKAEFVTMVIKALWQEHSEPAEIYYYKDVPQDYWAYDMIQKASDFDLLKTKHGENFRPEDNINKAEAIAIVISSVDAGEMTASQATKLLNQYNDLNTLNSESIIPIAKAEKFGLIATEPTECKLINPTQAISRAEIAVTLFNMRKQALLHPSDKLAQALTPQKAEGEVIQEATMEDNGIIAHIPAGTILEGYLLEELNSQQKAQGEMFKVKLANTYVTKENYLLLPEKTTIFGEIANVKKARYFVRNANMDLNAKRINIEKNSTHLAGNIDFEIKKENWFIRTARYIIKGKKVKLNKQETVMIKLTKPIKVDVTKTIILN